MNQPTPADITLLLDRISGGDSHAVDALMPLVYGELRRLARNYLSHERPGMTLQATALVHEAYLRLTGGSSQEWRNRAHFFAVAATTIRRLLVEHARRRARLKRGEGRSRVGFEVALNEVVDPASLADDRLVALDEALETLAAIDPPKARLVELRFFAGLTADEAAAALGVSASTAAREWRLARAWLHAQVEERVGAESMADPGGRP